MSNSQNAIIFRVDANTQIGTGHLMRCLALAQAWKDAGGEVIFITACQNENLLQRLREEGFDIHLLTTSYPDPSDWSLTKCVLAAYPDAWIVLDGYHFDETYQQWIKESGHRLLVIDDMAHLKHYYADIVLNQNLHAEQLHYSCEPYTHLLLGTKYVLLRREFLRWGGWRREIPDVARKVLVTMGGSDPENVTLKVIDSLEQVHIDGLEAVVVVGGSNQHFEALESAVKKAQIPIRLKKDVMDMAELMAWADIAISAGGSTCWELAFMGLPNLVVILAENQRPIAESLDQAGMALNLGWHSGLCSFEIAKALTQFLLVKEQRVEMARHAQEVVDGEGVLNTLKELSKY